MNESIANAPKCPNCGAPFYMRIGKCEYCGSHVERYKGPELPTRVTEVVSASGYHSISTAGPTVYFGTNILATL